MVQAAAAFWDRQRYQAQMGVLEVGEGVQRLAAMAILQEGLAVLVPVVVA